MLRVAPNRWGWLLVVPAALLFVWAQYTGQPDILLLSVIPIVLGGALVAVGSTFAASLLLPTLFLLFIYPIPAVIAARARVVHRESLKSSRNGVSMLRSIRD